MGLVPFKEGHCNGGMTIFSLQWYYYEWHRRIARKNSESKKFSLLTLLVPSVYSQKVFLLILSSCRGLFYRAKQGQLGKMEPNRAQWRHMRPNRAKRV